MKKTILTLFLATILISCSVYQDINYSLKNPNQEVLLSPYFVEVVYTTDSILINQSYQLSIDYNIDRWKEAKVTKLGKY
jgi:hypothetical protein